MSAPVIQSRNWLELITLRADDNRLSGIRWNKTGEDWIEHNGWLHHRCVHEITGLKDADYQALKSEYEGRLGNISPEFDQAAHWAKHNDSLIRMQRAFWFDLTDYLEPGESITLLKRAI